MDTSLQNGVGRWPKRIAQSLTVMTAAALSACVADSRVMSTDGPSVGWPESPTQQEIIRLLRNWPPPSVTAGEWSASQHKELFLTTLRKLAQYETSDLRNALALYMRSVEVSWPYWVSMNDAGSKIHCLNRVLFDVPRYANWRELRISIGWAGVPHTDRDLIDMHWPLRIDRGEIDLVCDIPGYRSSLPYDANDAIKEFDYFLAQHGRRKTREHDR